MNFDTIVIRVNVIKCLLNDFFNAPFPLFTVFRMNVTVTFESNNEGHLDFNSWKGLW